MTDGNNQQAGAAQQQAPPATSKPYRVFETEDQYLTAMNRKLANYMPKSEYQAALNRASDLEKSLGTLQAENAKLLGEIGKYKLGDLRKKVAKDAQLPDEWADELKGADEASMKEHAESLRKKLGIKQNVGNPVPTITPGAQQGPSENEIMNGLLLGISKGIPLPTGR